MRSAHQAPLSPRFLNIDLDGVLVDFDGAARRLLGRPYADTPAAEAWGVLDKTPRLYRDLAPLPDAMELWEGIQAFAAREGNVRARILSALPQLTNRLTTAPADKIGWVRAHLSPQIWVVLVNGGGEKALIARPGDILIDDLERNVRAWRAAGGVGVLHTSARATLARLNELGAVR